MADQQQTSRCDSYYSLSPNSYSTIMAKLIMAQFKSMGIAKSRVLNHGQRHKAFSKIMRSSAVQDHGQSIKTSVPHHRPRHIFCVEDRKAETLAATIQHHEQKQHFTLWTKDRDTGCHRSAPWRETQRLAFDAVVFFRHSTGKETKSMTQDLELRVFFLDLQSV